MSFAGCFMLDVDKSYDALNAYSTYSRTYDQTVPTLTRSWTPLRAKMKVSGSMSTSGITSPSDQSFFFFIPVTFYYFSLYFSVDVFVDILSALQTVLSGAEWPGCQTAGIALLI